MILIENLQEMAFGIIAEVGITKQKNMEALEACKKGQYDLMNQHFDEAKESFANAHKFHFEVIQAEANGEQLPYSVLFSHAEDQLLSVENLGIFCKEMTEVYQKIDSRSVE